MADFFTRLVSRTLSGLEPTVKPLIAPIYASGAKMADNYAVDPESELGFSGSGESDSEEYPMGQSSELLGISAAETINLASNVNRINWREIQPRDNFSEITSSEQLQLDNAITSENSIKTSSTEEPSSPITPSITPHTTIQKSTSQNTVNLQPRDNSSEIKSSEKLERDNMIASENLIETSSSSGTIQSLDNPSEITSSEQLEIDNAIAPKESIKTSSIEASSSPITSSITPPSFIQKSSNQNTSNVNPTIQPLDNSSDEQLEIDNAIAPKESIKTSSAEVSSSPITPSVKPPSFIQQSTNQENVTPTVQSLDNSSEIASSQQLEPDNVIVPKESIKTSSSEISSPLIQKLAGQETANVKSTIQPLDNSSEITSSEQLERDSAIATESTIQASSFVESSSPIAPSITPSTFIQKSSNQNTDNVTPTIQSLDNSSEIASSQQLQPDNAIATKSSIKNSSSGESPLPIAPSIKPSTNIQRISSQDTVNVQPQALESRQPPDSSSEIASSEQLNLNRAIAPNNAIKASSSVESSPPITPSITPPTTIQKSTSSEMTSSEPLNPNNAIAPKESIKTSSATESSSPITTSATTPNIIQKLSSSSVQSASSKIQPVSEIGIERSQTLSETPTEPSSRLVESQVAESSSLLQLNNQSFSERAKKVSLPLVKSEVIAQFSNSSLNLPEQFEPPVNRVESIQSIEINPAFESNISATSSSLPQSDLADAALSPPSSPSTSSSLSPKEESLASSRRLGITTQSKLVEEGVQPQQISDSKKKRVESNISSLSNRINSLVENDSVRREGDLFEIAETRLSQTNTIPFKIQPRIEITRQELFQLPEKLSDFAFPSNSQLPSRQLSQTGGLETASGSPRNLTNATTPSTPTINITIGRVEVRGIKPPEPPPLKKLRAKTPQLSLSDYLKERGGQ